MRGVSPGLGLMLLSVLVCTTPEVAAQSRVAVLDEPDGIVVGFTVVIGTGSAWEMRPETGLTYLAARGVVEALRPELEPIGGQPYVECDRTGIRFILMTPASSWRRGAERFLRAIFEEPPSIAAVESARRAILHELALTEAALSEEIRTTLATAEFGADARWTRPPCGRAMTMAALSATDARRMVETRFSPHRATAAVAGPVDREEAHQLIGRYIPDSDLPVLVPVPTGVTHERVQRVERNTVTAWIGLSFPFAKGTDTEALRLLAFILEDEISPHPTRPEIYDARVEIMKHGAGGSLIVYLVTAPPQASRWIDRVQSLIAGLAGREMQEPSFRALIRRYNGHRLLALESPEARARDAALQLFFEAGYTPAWERIGALEREALMSAAGALGRPAIAHLGPS